MKAFMNKKRKKKAFTIVELVIVIAVIAILAAVLIPTFSNVVDKANQSAALQEARNKYLEIYADDIADGVLDMKSPTANLTEGGNDADGKWTYHTDGNGNVDKFTFVKEGITVEFDGKNDWKVNGQSQGGGSNNSGGPNESSHEHSDVANDGNHTCDAEGCNETVNTCVDSDKNHSCDNDSTCDVFSTGENAHGDGTVENGTCEYCNVMITHECSDADNDGNHECDLDYCNLRVGTSLCTPAEDDGDCTTAIECTECGVATTAAKAHTDSTTDGNHRCDNDGCAIDLVSEHVEVIDQAKAATCTEKGLTEGKHCSDCNTVLAAQTETPATGVHTYTDGKCTCGRHAIEDRFVTHLTFDGESGNGKFGNGLDANQQHAETDLNPGTNSFTLSFWVKNNGITGEGDYPDPVLVSNKNWDVAGWSLGFTLGWEVRKPEGNKNILLFSAGSGEEGKRADVRYTLSESYMGEWIHIIAVVDREDNEVQFYINFNAVDNTKCYDKDNNVNTSLNNVKGISFNCGDYDINIGQDGTGEYKHSLNANIDEFIYFNGALTAEDVTALKNYYDNLAG